MSIASFNAALLDSASVHAAATTFERLNKNLRIHEINIAGVASLIDAYILFDKIVLPHEGWNYCVHWLPKDWLIHLKDVIEVRDIDFSGGDKDLENFLSSRINFYILNILIKDELDSDLRQHYMSYIGGDYGINDTDDQTLEIISTTLKRKWNWDYYYSNTEHIDPIHAFWRCVQYSSYCGEEGLVYYAHEYRARILDLQATLLDYKQVDLPYKKIIDELKREIISDRLKQKKEYPAIYPLTDEDILLWKALQFPLFAGIVFQKSKTAYDIFDEASRIRIAASSLREMLKAINTDLYRNPERWEGIYNEISSEMKGIFKPEDKSIQYSFGWGFPFGVSYSISDTISRKKPYLALMRNLKDSRSIPLTLRSDIARLFPMPFMYEY